MESITIESNERYDELLHYYLLIGDNFVVSDKLFVKYSIVFKLDNKVVQTPYLSTSVVIPSVT